MRQVTLLLIFLFSVVTASGQYIITIEAQVVDIENNIPIPYVNVGFVNKAIGTVTDDTGKLTLEFDESRITKDDVIQFSIVGFQTKSFSFQQLIEKFQSSNIVKLSKEVYDLDEVLITAKWGKAIKLGSRKATNKLLAYWKDKNALGGEIAQYIKLPKGKFKLSELTFNIVENISDSVKIRVNVYDYKRGYPKDKYLTTPIYKTITKKQGLEKVNLSSSNLIVNDDIVISIELLEVYGDELGLAISQSLTSKKSFLRYVSQDSWSRQNANGIDLSVTARPALEISGNSIEKSKVETVSIFWDVSRSMIDRNIEDEIKLLRAFLRANKPRDVKITNFSNTINSVNNFTYPFEEDLIYSTLKNQQYYGNTDLTSVINVTDEADVTLLFSDGNFNLTEENVLYTAGELVIISATVNSNNRLLSSWALENDGKYLPINGDNFKEMKLALLADSSIVTETLQVRDNPKEGNITGKVLLNNLPLQDVIVSIKGSLNEVTTDQDGFFSIKGKVGDILTFEYLNTLPKEVVIIESNDLIVKLESEFDVLNEVNINGKGGDNITDNSSVEERQNQKNKAGGQFFVLEKKDFPQGAYNLAGIMRGIPAVQVKGFGREAVFLTRGSRVGLFIIDDIPFNEVPPFINVNTVMSVSVIPSIIGATKYGPLARNGVIIITTVNNEKYRSQKVDSALVKGNLYRDDLQELDTTKGLNSFENTLTNIAVGKEVVINGRVLLNSKPVQGCYVIEKGTLNETITNTDGKFSIKSNIGVRLSFEYKDSKPKEIIIVDTAYLKIELESLYEVLNEVALEGKAKQEQQILTAKEKRNAQKDRSGIGYQSMDKEDFNNGTSTYLVDLIRGRFLTIGINGEGDQARYYTRKPSSIVLDPTIPFAVDGVLTTEPPTFLNLNSIENITYKSTLAGTNKYGALGRNGVIEITTSRDEFQKKEDQKSALVKNNIYKRNAKVFSSSRLVSPYGQVSLENIELIRNQFLEKIESDPLDVNNYIAYYRVMEPINQEEAIRGLFTIIDLGPNNTRVLRSLAFFLEDQKLFEEAHKIYKRIIKLAPKESQSYLDLAQSAKNAKNYTESFEALKRIFIADTTVFGVSEELIRIAETEMKHLLTKHKDKVNYTEVPSSFYETVHIIDKRILVEWNDPQMEFDLQFVNPSNKFYNWSQTLSENNISQDSSIRNGLLSKEFIIDDDTIKGEWIINITNNSRKEPRIPSFVKITVQSNYGNVTESEQTLVIPVSQLDQKYTVQKINL